MSPVPLFPRRPPATPVPVRIGEPASAKEVVRERPLEPDSTLALTLQAYAEGFSRGRAEGEAQALAMAESACSELRRAAVAVASARAEVTRTLEREVVELALVVARQVLRAEAESGTALVERLVALGLSRLGECEHVTVRLNPADATQLSPERTGTAGSVSFVPDPQVERGGAIVESEIGRVDARLETQMEELRRELAARMGGPP
jgi:flagellar biosynthesis/type III secretory pathway protein FliH